MAVAILHCRRRLCLLDFGVRHFLRLPLVAGRYLEQSALPGLPLPDNAGRLCCLRGDRLSVNILLLEEDLWADQGRLDAHSVQCTIEHGRSGARQDFSMITKRLLSDRRHFAIAGYLVTALAFLRRISHKVAAVQDTIASHPAAVAAAARRQDGAARAGHASGVGGG